MVIADIFLYLCFDTSKREYLFRISDKYVQLREISKCFSKKKIVTFQFCFLIPKREKPSKI